MRLNLWFLTAGIWALSGLAAAQELRCTQIFMNPSEKRICATPSLMQLDKQMGEVGRRAAMHQKSFKSDQRKFRKALKACKGDEACLTTSYENRITELQSFIDTLSPPTDAEMVKLAVEAQKAAEKRDAQADTRKRIAESLGQSEPAAALLPPENLIQPEAVVEEPVAVLEEPLVAPVQPAEPTPPQKADEDKPGWGTWIIALVIVVAIVAAFVDWLFKAVRRCPRCTKWRAGKIYDQDRESYTDYETREFVDERRDRNNALVGTTRKKRQVAVRVTKRTDYLRCELCQHEWVIHSSSRSS